MKKIFFALAISSISLLSYAQPSYNGNEFYKDSTIKEAETPQDRISKLEAEVKDLKATNAAILQQLADIKNQLPVARKNRVEASRAGSKQPVSVE